MSRWIISSLVVFGALSGCSSSPDRPEKTERVTTTETVNLRSSSRDPAMNRNTIGDTGQYSGTDRTQYSGSTLYRPRARTRVSTFVESDRVDLGASSAGRAH
jgi:hypothetical protein